MSFLQHELFIRISERYMDSQRFLKRRFDISPELSDCLNLCRWVAALLVMIGHLRDFLFVGADRLASSGLVEKGFYYVTGFGHHAVMIFFVMSGFLVGGRALDQFINRSFLWRNYLIDRSTRIYIVFLLALGLGGLWDFIGLNFFNQLGLYNLSHGFHFSCDLANRDVSHSLDPGSLIGNVLMLQNLHVSVFGSNGPLWSLAYEWWYYLLFPLLTMIFYSNRFSGRAIGGLGSVCVIAFLPVNTLLYFGIWLMGVIVRTRIIPPFIGKISGFVVFIISISAIRAFGGDSLYLDYVLGGLFALFVNEVYQCSGKNKRVSDVIVKLNSHLANFSYSLYVLHFPFILLSINVMHMHFGLTIEQQPTFQYFLLFVGMAVTTCLYAFFVSLFTESKTASVRYFIYSRLLGDGH